MPVIQSSILIQDEFKKTFCINVKKDCLNNKGIIEITLVDGLSRTIMVYNNKDWGTIIKFVQKENENPLLIEDELKRRYGIIFSKSDKYKDGIVRINSVNFATRTVMLINKADWGEIKGFTSRELKCLNRRQ